MNRTLIFLEGEGGAGKTTVLHHLTALGWGTTPELPSFSLNQSWSHLLSETNQSCQLREQHRFLQLEAARYFSVLRSSEPRHALDRSFFSTLAYSYAIEQHWSNEIYEETLNLVLEMVEHHILPVPHLLVILEAPLTVRRRRCDLRDSAGEATATKLAYRDLHKSTVFSAALSVFYSCLPERIEHLIPTFRVENMDSSVEVAKLIHEEAVELKHHFSESSKSLLRDALSGPSEWGDQRSCAL